MSNISILSASAKIVTAIYWILNFRIVLQEKGFFYIAGPPKVYGLLITSAILIHLLYIFGARIILFLSESTTLFVIIHRIHLLLLPVNAVISIFIKVKTDEWYILKTYMKLKEVYKILKQEFLIFDELSEISENMRTLYLCYFTLHAAHGFYHIAVMGSGIFTAGLILSNVIIDLTVLQFVIDIDLIVTCLQNINLTLRSFDDLSNEVDFRSTFLTTDYRNNEIKNINFVKCSNNGVMSLVNAYDMVYESTKTITANFVPTVNIIS